jgi:hypothetical protein
MASERSIGSASSVRRPPTFGTPVRPPARPPARPPVARTATGARRTTPAEIRAYTEHAAGLNQLHADGMDRPGGWQQGLGLSDDPLAGLFQATPPARPSGGGGGGGGGRSGPSAAEVDAYKALFDSMNNDALMGEYARQEEANRALYDPAKVNARYDQLGQGVTAADTAGQGRLAGIMQELAARAATGRTDVSQAYQAGDTALQGIRSRFGGMNAAGNQELNSVLGAFGAGSVGPGESGALDRLFAQGQIGNQRAATVADAGMADRGVIHGGLNADVSSGMTRDRVGLESQIAAKRAQDLQGNDAALQQVLGQIGVARIQAQQAQLQQQMELRMKLAELGIQV